MLQIVFATNNYNKLKEIRHILPPTISVLGLSDIGFDTDIPENGLTLKENATIKSSTIYERFNIDCFSDDTGLMVDDLNDAPGVYSARYAGENASYDDNVEKLLKDLEGSTNRSAHFSTVISLFLGGIEYFFEGRIDGIISHKKSGHSGFGYDPIFIPDGYDITFSEMSSKLKNSISHRGLATSKLVKFLKDKI
ncbi:MAG: RdgB/HAM1 family non-canonical purine NTP pyrophosphatase [Lentimicrobiaceae bacterium]|jgi:XTP/dITP diphosphohydrolase|nr:RdgB/HAM1 family non-canonical purine NTP pyrophosphatase [Lentimicrobiaceae bacterium]MCP4910227.1 RdgB/HAM1 family non-canonical purine NTP pyrophosphatase [Bacteroidota bacterium]MBT3453423.1 RdgB/HAM1 family non-canonical purine NTP pyrophosphatase [Lentimicrobiaceae bacterium]MBT3819401.1 RdgB/HAM1 family non-canonical purine NTP pyrophosphatase [Lentimicrobiaceae bacterium]MBT4061865.1 RdgB/HAM1 family non-canonical purine NTP pyrophosphatase [Lentimicrobiaceae bacterium]